MDTFEKTCRELIESGRKIFPLKNKSKAPLKNGFYECVNQSSDKQLEELLNAQLKNNTENMGMIVGTPSGLVTIDLDFKHPEAQAYWEEHNELLSQGVVVSSGNGKHCHFQHPYLGFDKVMTSIGMIDKGIDILCDTNTGYRYVVIPPSIHPSGAQYRYDSFETLSDKLPELPLDLLNLIEDRSAWKFPKPDSSKAEKEGKFDPDFYVNNPQVLFQVDPFCDEPIGEGGRNNTLCSIAGKLLSMHIGDDTYDILDLTSAMLEINRIRCDPPLPDAEIEALCASIMKTNTASKKKEEEATTPTPQPEGPPKLTLDSNDIQLSGAQIGGAFTGSVTMDPPESQPSPSEDPNMCAVWALHQPPFKPTQKGGDYSLIRMEDMFFMYTENVWRNVTDQYVESILQSYFPAAKTSQLRNMINFMKNHLYFPVKSIPFWKTGQASPGYSPDCRKLIPFKNGIFDVEHYIASGDMASSLKPHNENLFNTVKLDYDFDEKATCPTWDSFLTDVWDDINEERIEALQQWAGHLMIPDISQHKIAVIHGVPRSGKSTIGRVLSKLIGEKNSCATDLHTLASEHGLMGLVGKNLAVIFDAHIPTSQTSERSIEKLKGISGADPQNINPKFGQLYTMTLTSRIMMVCNEIPRLRDGGNALLARIIPFRCNNSFSGREKHNLEANLLKELPGIANWAIQGIKSYVSAGRLMMPRQGLEDQVYIKRFLNPVSAFMDDCIKYPVTSKDFVSLDQLHTAWSMWSEANFITGRMSKDRFFNGLRAVCPPRAQGRLDGELGWFGVLLREDVEKLCNKDF